MFGVQLEQSFLRCARSPAFMHAALFIKRIDCLCPRRVHLAGHVRGTPPSPAAHHLGKRNDMQTLFFCMRQLHQSAAANGQMQAPSKAAAVVSRGGGPR